jgi:hypothetical protein
MTTLTATRPPTETGNIRVCARCGVHYDWRRSTSGSLKMTYCGSLCERSDLGFTIEGLLRSRRSDEHGPPPIAA